MKRLFRKTPPPAPPEPVESEPPADPDRATIAAAFDPDFYRRHAPDVAAAGIDPLDHFMEHGWREGRDPNADFSMFNYVSDHPELVGSGINPFLHFLTTPPAVERAQGFRYDVIERLASIESRIGPARSPVPTGDPQALKAALEGGARGLSRLHVSFSHDDYTAHLGGVQLGVQREAARLGELGVDHLHIHPARAWQLVRTSGEPGQLGVLWNGVSVGAFEADAIVDALRRTVSGPPEGRSFAIHSLLGQTADETADILAAAGLSEGFFWLHDFASLCAGFHLLRNDVEDCAAPPPESQACEICLYGPWRARHLAQHQRLFRRLKLTVVSPSQPTLDLWRRAWTHPPAAAFVVHPHAGLVPRGRAPEPEAGRPFRLAYAGLPVDHKGWPVFRTLAANFKDDPRYQFVHLGARRVETVDAPFHRVVAGADRPRAMQEALEAHDIDAVLIWPLCRETFSFVAYEAVAAGCALLTNPDSGNVAAFTAEGGHGTVLANEAALAEAFETGEILSLGRARRRPMLYDLTFSALTADLLKAPQPA